MVNSARRRRRRVHLSAQGGTAEGGASPAALLEAELQNVKALAFGAAVFVQLFVHQDLIDMSARTCMVCTCWNLVQAAHEETYLLTCKAKLKAADEANEASEASLIEADNSIKVLHGKHMDALDST